ncbi:hypothetical protein QTI17_01340 [Variovorax sp. J31P179]|nr:hypothetical protein [Variovorax sp. J31P179]
MIATIAGGYALAIMLLYWAFGAAGIPLRPLFAYSGAAVVDLALLAFFCAGWRRLWARMPRLNQWLYPDLNGVWDASIDWVRGEQVGRAVGRVIIKQDFFKISIEMDAERSESRTLALAVKKDPESSRPLLHYIYEVREKYTSPGQNKVYQGAASLVVGAASNDELVGNYFTSRGTGGRFHFCRLPEPLP